MRFKSFYKSLKEDKLLTKEDDGGAVSDGSVVQGQTSSSSEIQSSKSSQNDIISNNGAVRYDDILGKCDHAKEGWFGPHCFHRPMPIFSYPLSRIPKKKKKYIKVLDLTEDENYSTFKNIFETEVKKQVEIAKNELRNIDGQIDILVDGDYEFKDEKENWVAALNKEQQNDSRQFIVAFNVPMIYDFLCSNGLEDDVKEIECQIKASLYHEIGHALIDYFKSNDIYDMELTDEEEEEIVEEYAKYQLREYTGKTSSRLQKTIDRI